MTWKYSQSTGKLYRDDILVGVGYAGTGAGRNNPEMQNVVKTGPLPRGWYTIGKAYQHPKLGPVVMNLEPDQSNKMYGRSLFRIHGDNPKNDASEGCIVMGPVIRKIISSGTDCRLQVTE